MQQESRSTDQHAEQTSREFVRKYISEWTVKSARDRSLVADRWLEFRDTQNFNSNEAERACYDEWAELVEAYTRSIARNCCGMQHY